MDFVDTHLRLGERSNFTGILRAMLCLSALLILGAAPASQPTDPSMDWILSHATTAPSDAVEQTPATEPSVLQAGNILDEPTRPGVITLSDGSTIKGGLSTTYRQPLHVWIGAENRFADAPFSMIASIEVHITSESEEKEWMFAASGSDVKEFSGKTYPVRETDYVITMKDGTTISGGVAAPIYLDDGAGRHIYILHKRDKGEPGEALKDLVYVKEVKFAD